MNTKLQPAAHPDAEQLAAFAEQGLPEHEQAFVLRHLADCRDCREVVFLAHEGAYEEEPVVAAVAASPYAAAVAAAPAIAPAPVPSRPWFFGWLTRWNLVLPAAVAVASLFAVTVYLRRAPVREPAVQTAVVEQPPSSAVPVTAAVASPSETAQLEPATPAMKQKLKAASPAPLKVPAPAAIVATDGSIGLAAPAQLRGAMDESAAIAVNGGRIDGRIADPAGRVVPHAQVIATNTETGVQTRSQSTESGLYTLAPLLPGRYNVEIVARGFQRLLQENVALNANQRLGLDARLNVGGGSTIAVTNAPPQLDTTNARFGGTIENELYTNAPLSMGGSPRNPTGFQRLMPGAQEGSQQQLAKTQPVPPVASGGLQQGVYGGTGQTNLNENYVEGIPVSNVQAQGGSSPVAKAISIDSAAAATAPAVSPARVGGIGGALSSRALAAAARPRAALPSHLATVSSAFFGGHTLAIDSAGALFLSDDAGVTWTPVAVVWKGRAVRLSVVPSVVVASPRPMPAVPESQGNIETVAGAGAKPAQTSVFELTTDSGAVWTSPDGQTWALKE